LAGNWLKALSQVGKPILSVARATRTAKMTYASPAWWAFTSKEEKMRLKDRIRKAFMWAL